MHAGADSALPSVPELAGLSFLSGGGELGRLIAARDWAATPVGPI
jgi:hypothetical protein